MERIPTNPDSGEVSASTSESLLLGLERQSATVYSELTSRINHKRKPADQLEVLSKDRLMNEAEAWLRDPQVLAAVKLGLHDSTDEPVALLAVPHADFSHEEVVDTWDFASHNDRPRQYKYRAENFWRNLNQWDSKSLCYFNPNDPTPVRFVIAETGFDATRTGPRLVDEANFDPSTTTYQLQQLRSLRSQNSYIYPMDLFAGAVNAYRWKHQPSLPQDIEDQTYVWDVMLQPDDAGCIAGDGWIPTGSLNAMGYGDVSFVTGMYGNYSRRMVMKR